MNLCINLLHEILVSFIDKIYMEKSRTLYMNIFSNYNIYMYINCILYITNLFKKKNSKFIKEKNLF